MTRRVHVVDYGVGNLYSVSRAVEKAGGEVCLSDDHAEIAAADRLILPGVGAFRDGMAGLASRGLDEAVTAFAATGRPLLGICLGMQMLASESLEFGSYRGLGLVPGRVRPIPRHGVNGTPHKIPFIGWAALEPTRPEEFAGTPLYGVTNGDSIYLVHSFHVEPENAADTLAVYRYNGVPVTAAVGRDNIFGCQFHPEKSGPVGLGIIGRFLTV
jgi:imidazole glycerol-phosphate synthase subunit HisH